MTEPTTTGGLTWYAVLGVEPDASAAEIKAAWREATDKFEPGSGAGQSRLFNEAADVLLDPDQRRAYDAQLRGDATHEQQAVLADAPPPPAVEPDVVQGESESVAETLERALAGSSTRSPDDVTDEVTDGVTDEVTDGVTDGVTDEQRRLIPLWLLAVLAVLTIAVAAAGGVVFVNQHRADQVSDAGQAATEAAQRALPAILSYDYRELSADRARAGRYLTPKYRKEYNATFNKLVASNGQPGPAEQAKAVVKATVADNAVGVVQAQPDRVRVIAFVDQTTVKNGTAATQSLNRLTVSLRKSGNSWLVDDIVSY